MPSSRIFFLLVVLLVGCSSVVQAQQFDESFDLWPVQLKIRGTVIIGGGGTLPSDATKMIAAVAAKEDARPVHVRFANELDAESDSRPEAPFGESPSETVVISSDQVDLTAKQVEAITSSLAIWIEGPATIRERMRIPLRQVLRACKSAIGNGATVATNGSVGEYMGQLRSESSMHLTSIEATSDLVPNAVVMTHYDDDKNRKDMLSTLAAYPRSVGVGIEEDSAIVLRGRKIRVVGEGTATFCLMANEQKPLRIQHVSQARNRRSSPYATIVDLTAWRRDAIERTVEPFPPQVPPDPNVPNGTLIIVGGGGMPNGLMRRMVELAGGSEARLVYVPCSERDEITGSQRTVESWKKMGVRSATFLHTKDRLKSNSDDAFLAPLKDATGIWFGGGRQWNFADSYYGTRAHQMMKEVLHRGGVVGGSSAGASIQARYLCRANPVANFDIMAPGYERGLGFIGGVAIDQHFSQRGRQKDMTQLVGRYPQLLGIGIDEATALIVTKSQAEIVGRGKVHFYDRNQPVIPGAADFVALGAGSVFDLTERKEIVAQPVAEIVD